MVKLKICGLTRPQDIEAVNQILPEYMGLVFAESRRKLEAKQALVLAEKLNNRIKKVGVFVNEKPETIIELSKAGIIDVIQLHGDEDEAYIYGLKERLPKPIIKAVRVQSPEQVIQVAKLACDYLLLDTYTQGQYGGSGKVFDWRLIPKINKPFFLAGGLHEANILQALKSCTPYAVDISSGVESNGLKDKAKIIKIAEIVRSVN